MNRIKRISAELLQNHSNRFGLEFDANKKALNDLAVVRSKVLRNELAGYITAHLRKQAAQEKASMEAAAGEAEEEIEIRAGEDVVVGKGLFHRLDAGMAQQVEKPPRVRNPRHRADPAAGKLRQPPGHPPRSSQRRARVVGSVLRAYTRAVAEAQ
mgnify:CR=1 FL=1